MKTVTIICPKCKREHALMWWQGKSGKRKLGAFCDRGLSTRAHKSGTVLVERTLFVEVALSEELEKKLTKPDLENLPTYLTPEARKQAKQVGQGQLAMLLVQPGEKVERGSPLHEVFSKEDAALAETLKQDIEINLRKQKEVKAQLALDHYALKALEAEELSLRRQLREVWTEPLKFSL